MRPDVREEPCRSALNRVRGMPFEWSLNPYMGCSHRCTYCYVRAFEKRADRPWDERYGTSIRVKTNVAEVLDRELSRRSWLRESVAVGAATDPYQPIEARYRLTRACIGVLARRRTPFGLITRGPLVLRDLDVLQDAARVVRVGVSMSVPTLDEHVWAATEPGTSHPRARLRALRRMAEAGLRVSLALAPVLPGISDSPEQLEAVFRAAREAGVSRVWSDLVHLQAGAREHFLACVARDFPDQLAHYEELFRTRGYAPAAFRRAHGERIAELRDRIPAGPPLAPLVVPEAEPPVFAQQLGLALA